MLAMMRDPSVGLVNIVLGIRKLPMICRVFWGQLDFCRKKKCTPPLVEDIDFIEVYRDPPGFPILCIDHPGIPTTFTLPTGIFHSYSTQLEGSFLSFFLRNA